VLSTGFCNRRGRLGTRIVKASRELGTLLVLLAPFRKKLADSGIYLKGFSRIASA
jgi:hypothetical protein